MKKNKKQKEVVPELVLGEKIRDVKLNQKEHFLLFVTMLIVFNLILLASVWFVLLKLNAWYNWIICMSIMGLSLYLSFREYRSTKVFNSCTLYDNAISINSIWFNLKVELKDIYEMDVKETGLDKTFKLNTKSLQVKILGAKRKSFTIHFIEEDAVKLKQEITMLIDNYVQKLEQNKNN